MPAVPGDEQRHDAQQHQPGPTATTTHREQPSTLQYWSTNEPGLITEFAERFNMPEQVFTAAIPASSRVLPHLVTSTFCGSE
jgi:hypothetical protein